jgi:hypothetical protein
MMLSEALVYATRTMPVPSALTSTRLPFWSLKTIRPFSLAGKAAC